MKILHVINSLDPAFGGTVATVVLQSTEMLHQGHQVEILTLDDSSAPFLTSVPGTVHALGPSFGKYCLNFRMVGWLKKHAYTYDIVLVHGLWQFQSFGIWLASRQVKFDYFIYSHGMLDPWFKKTYPLKHGKKLLYWILAEYRVLRDAKGVLFTCEEEKNLARESFSLYNANEIVAELGVKPPNDNPVTSKNTFFNKFPQLQNKHYLLFLSRIHPKKGCDLLIKAFAQVKDLDPSLQLVMAGPDQTGWVANLQELSKTLGVEDRITWTGMLNGDLKWGAFRAAEVFVLPSHTENFGVVIAEALACGLPVLTTNKVNIWRELQQAGAGFVANDDLEGISTLLQSWLKTGEEERENMRKSAMDCFTQKFEISHAVKNLIDTLNKSTQSN